MRVYDIIDKKKKNKELTKEELYFFCQKIATGEATDSQISAFCMATLLNGMSESESINLTFAMRDSGAVISRPEGEIFADKHSTGGVSDSTTLILVPILSALGVKCAKLSGRGLAHTGGTLDKLESIPNFNVNLTGEQFEKQVKKIGAAIAGQTQTTVPADKRMYAVRDITATVDSIPLIASSVMSKKLASFADVILLDVKYGNGAFMKTAQEAKELSSLMVKIGIAANRKVCAVISSMQEPLGDNIGCNLEVRECISVLKGKENRLFELSIFHSAKILQMAKGVTFEKGLELANGCIKSGKALSQFEKIILAQGGNARVLEDFSLLPLAKNRREILASDSGYLKVDALLLGTACAELGGGRLKEDDNIDHTVGITLEKRTGDKVEKGEVIAVEYSNDKKSSLVEKAFIVEKKKVEKEPLVFEVIE